MHTSRITYYPSLSVKDNAKKNGVTEEPTFYKRVCEEMGKAMYFNFKNGE